MIALLPFKKQQPFDCVLTFGNFDGVHLGHQYLLTQLKNTARSLNLPAVVLTFEPLPKAFFNPDLAPARITTAFEKYYLLRQLGFEHIHILRFNQTLAKMSAEEFLKMVLQHFCVKHFVVGNDVRFGSERTGDLNFLTDHAKILNYGISIVEKFAQNDHLASSSLIRNLLLNNKIDGANDLLGRNFSITGKINYGHARGRTIGFPTINIPIKRKTPPFAGVYAVEIIIENKRYSGVANMGNRPTIDGQHWLLEVNLFEMQENIYGKRAEVFFMEKLRDEKKFADFSELKKQIMLDAEHAKTLAIQNKNKILKGIFHRGFK